MRMKWDCTKRVLFTLVVILLNLTLANIPVPGVDRDSLAEVFRLYDVLEYADTLTGGGLSNLSITGFGISSYITASIILQLLSVAFPSLDLTRMGAYGRRVYQRINILTSVALTFLCGMALVLTSRGSWGEAWYLPVISLLCWMMGTGLITVLAVKIEEFGIGNGVSLILTSNILSSVPAQVYDSIQSAPNGVVTVTVFLILIFVMYMACAYCHKIRLEIPLIQEQKAKTEFNEKPVLMIPANVSGVLPVVYASVLLSIPSVILSVTGLDEAEIGKGILCVCSSNCWYRPEHWYYSMGIFIYLFLVGVFCRISSRMSFNSHEITNRMKQTGDVIEGVLPGEPTVDYLERRRKWMSNIGFLFLAFLSMVPDAVCVYLGVSQVRFFGSSMIIVFSTLRDLGMRLKSMVLINRKRQFLLFFSREAYK